jgi:pilus assembly protein CpaF
LCQEPNISFDAARLRTGLEVIANHLGKRLDEDNPRLQAQLPDGSRIAAWIPPLVSPAPAIAIRKFTSRNYTVDDLIARGTLTQAIADLLAEQIRSGKTLLISGGTGTGKTTLLRILANSIPENERILVIEDTPELQIRKPNIVAVGSQTSTFKTNVSFDDLLKDTLRFRPDRDSGPRVTSHGRQNLRYFTIRLLGIRLHLNFFLRQRIGSRKPESKCAGVSTRLPSFGP